MKFKENHNFGVYFLLARDNIVRYCEVVTDDSEDIPDVVNKGYGDLYKITMVEDNGEYIDEYPY